MKIDLAIVARDLKLPPEQIEKTVELLDAGNTIPFITRFRKDLTGGLNEQQILATKQRVAQLRALAERKSFVLKSIESQGKLAGELATEINKATTSRRLEDLYLPFKPKKQSRASLARQQGLEPLAQDIFLATSPDVDIATRATEFVRVDKGLTSVDDVIKGVGDLLAERFSENNELRSTLRKIMWNDGKLTSQSIPVPAVVEEQSRASEVTSVADKAKPKTTVPGAPAPVSNTASTTPISTADADAPGGEIQQAKLSKVPDEPTPQALKEIKSKSVDDPVRVDPSAESAPSESTAEQVANTGSELAKSESAAAQPETAQSETVKVDAAQSADSPTIVPELAQASVESPSPMADSSSVEESPIAKPTGNELGAEPGSVKNQLDPAATKTEPQATEPQATEPQATEPVAKPPKPKKKKKKKKKPAEDPFKDFHNFNQPIKQLPNHRILAINRGERAGRLKVKITVDDDKLSKASIDALVPAEHPFREFLQKCANDALNRLVAPSLEREIRRELTESAEKHAVEVFANNLRNLLLQPPIRNRTVVAIDPGFKRGCSVAVLDPFGNVLDSGHVFVVGNQSRRDESKQRIAEWVKRFKADVIAIGNGAACRQTEQMVSDTIAEQLKELQTTYVMVNEAGASTYSTSEIGRSELPDVSPSIRSAISIGRRLQDPLSELVKISPANIGVGMYQHDVKAKHLSESLDEVVRFCVNQVGVDVNTASPSLLKYVSGLNSLTARRVVEYRQANGKVKNRNQLKEISGFGEATFVQSAGFLRIHGGDTPLDCTSIHPESYEIASDVLKRIDVPVEEFIPKENTALKTVSETPQPGAVDAGTLGGDSTNVDSTGDSPSTAPSELTTAPNLSASTPTPVAPVIPAAAETRAADAPEPVVEVPATTENAASGTVQSPEQTTSSKAAKVEAQPPASVPAEPSPAEPVSAPEQAKQPDSGNPETPTTVAESLATNDARVNVSSARRKEVLKKINNLQVDELAQHHSAGKLLINDILMALKRPNWDPRDKVSKPIFRRGIINADDLKPSMQLDGQVVNVVDFGVFVDIGLGESSLVHVSQLSNHFIREPHRFYAVGDVLKVWVSEIDSQRRRVKLTAVRPGSKKPTGRRARGSSPRDSASANSRGSAGSGESRGSTPTARKPGKYGNKYGGGAQGKPAHRPGYGKSNPSHKSHVRRSKPKEVKPITDKMLKGDEPMRSFSDLAQFVNKKPKDSKDGNPKTEKDSSS